MISISNIAWDISLNDQVAALMQQNNIQHIDITHSKYFTDIENISIQDINRVKAFWAEKNILPLGMQSLLFGTQGLNVFGTDEVQEQLLSHLAKVCKIGNLLGATKLVFGSPRNRDRAHLSDKESIKIATSFFEKLGNIAKNENVVICLEPNPTCYQANFMVNSIETAEMVDLINHENIRMQLDVGAMEINKENPSTIVKNFHHLIHHIHISEPNLAPLNINNPFHQKAAQAIQAYLPSFALCIEMLTTNNALSLKEIEQSFTLINHIYLGKSQQ